ncbi:hypothetical protein ACTFIY_002573 [Dictyostelium cf. discoideum]
MTILKCSYGTKCLVNYSLPTQITKCIKYLREGDECVKQNDESAQDPLDNLCIRGTKCLLDKKNVYRCSDYGFSTVGEGCELDSDCATKELICVNQKCTLDSKKCKGDNANCKYDEFCGSDINIPAVGYNSSCELIKLGEPCSSSYACLGNLICRKNGRCSQTPFVQLGGVCPGNDGGICDYNKGLYCSNDDKCYDTVLTPPEYNKNFYSNEWIKCAYDNECSKEVNLISSKSCISKHCRKEICKRFTSDYKSKQLDDCGRDALVIDLFCNSSFKITQSISSLFIILSLIFVFIL